MLRIWIFVVFVNFCLSGCGDTTRSNTPNQIDQQLEEMRRRREEPTKKANRIEYQKNKDPHCLGY